METSSATEPDSVTEAFELCALAAIKAGRAKRKTASTTTSSTSSYSYGGLKSASNRNLSNVSFGSVDKRSLSSLKKSSNVSFSGSESEMRLNHQRVATPDQRRSTTMEDDDVFPGYDDDSVERRHSRCLPPLSPRFVRGGLDRQRRPHRSSLGILRSPEEEEEEVVGPPLLTSTAVRSPPSQVRPGGLARRTSFRQEQQMQKVVPVSSPKSPISDVAKAGVDLVGKKIKVGVAGFESLNTTGSQGSTGSSKASSTSTSSSSSSSAKSVVGLGPVGSLMSPVVVGDPDRVPNTEDPELLAHLNFVSPKTGVFRPAAANGDTAKRKQSCCVM